MAIPNFVLTPAEILASVLAGLALLVSIVSALFTYRGMRLADRQEARRHPKLVPVLVAGHTLPEQGEGQTVYAFNLTISNPADTDNAVASVELRLTYAAQQGVVSTVKVPASADAPQGLPGGLAALLKTPVAVGAHGTVGGWTCFAVPHQLLDGAVVEGTMILVLDSHGLTACVEPIMVQELHHGR